MKNRLTFRRVLAVFLGNILIGVSVALYRSALLGNDPSSAFVMALAGKCGVMFSQMLLVCNAVWFAAQLLWGRNLIGLGTFVNWGLVGYVTDGFGWLMNCLGATPETLAARVLAMLVATPLVSLGVSLYQTAGLGASPSDSLALMLHARLKKIPYFWNRIFTDSALTLFAWLLGGVVGIGTLTCALGLGPLIHFFDVRVSRKFCSGGKKQLTTGEESV